ncbi:MAG: hypothetical protein RBR48_05615, partial [Bacilli bacterium]|nr:hypothetical protein [Bacilli bacterium]
MLDAKPSEIFTKRNTCHFLVFPFHNHHASKNINLLSWQQKSTSKNRSANIIIGLPKKSNAHKK